MSRGLFRALLLAAALVPVSALADGPLPADPDSFFFHSTFGDFRDELELAREQGKKAIFIFFEMDECPFCHRMRREVLNQPEVQAYYREHFLNFTVDIEGDLEMVDFEGRTMSQKSFSFHEHRVRATPVLMFFDLDGEAVVRFTGSTSGVEEFLWLGEYVAEGTYREMPFARYKRMKRKSLRQ